MNLAKKFGEKSYSVVDKRQEVINEIVDSFRPLFTNGRFDDYLESRLDDEVAGKRSFTVNVEFWRYMNGCSNTYFGIGKFRWTNTEGYGYESCYYKGVELRLIQKDVGEQLVSLLLSYLACNGFRTTVRAEENWLNNFHKVVTISW